MYFDVDFYDADEQKTPRVVDAVKKECAALFKECFGINVEEEHWRITDGCRGGKASFHMTLRGCGFFPDNTHAMRQVRF